MKLEALIKEDRLKYNQSHQKSFEIIEKYNNELKLFKAQQSNNNLNDLNKLKAIAIEHIEKQTQTIDLSDIEMVVAKVLNFNHTSEISTQTDADELVVERLRRIHSSYFVSSSSSQNTDNMKLCDDIEEYLKKLNKRVDEVDEEKRKLNESLEQLKNECKQLKEAKSKLEVLYKVKCKSDLDKSSLIKKIKTDYEMELMKFRNEENSDLVHHLEKQLSLKELQIMEQSYELESWRSHETTINSVGLHGIGSNSIASSFHQDHTSSLNTFLNPKVSYSKKVPVDILYTSDPDVVTSTVF
jgi:hypothetical protein